MTAIDPWFLKQICEVVELETEPRRPDAGLDHEGRVPAGEARRLVGRTRSRAAWEYEPLEVRERRKELGVAAVFNRVDTCAAEFESFTPYLYSSYESEDEAERDRHARRS